MINLINNIRNVAKAVRNKSCFHYANPVQYKKVKPMFNSYVFMRLLTDYK